MIGPAGSFSAGQLEDLVRDALLHLYDAAYLLTHPLARAVDAPAQSTVSVRGKLLAQALLDAIESLRPPVGSPAESRGWRIYRLLELRYIGGLSSNNVPDRLGISKSQYQRDHARALEALAAVLRGRWRLPLLLPPSISESGTRESLAVSEAEQIAAQMSRDYVDLAATLQSLRPLIQSAVEENRIELVFATPSDPVTVLADRVALRQALLGLLSEALDVGGRVTVKVETGGPSAEVRIDAAPATGAASPGHTTQSSPEIEVARRLVEALGGELEVEAQHLDGTWLARMSLPVAYRPSVLVVDNHPDFIGLISRYLAEDVWQVAGAQDVRQAKLKALELHPSVILLDVMMPGQDGWDLLLDLKSRPETKAIPVIICSVLYEPRMARALGAVDYLPKPISQTALLEALAPYRQGRLGRESAC